MSKKQYYIGVANNQREIILILWMETQRERKGQVSKYHYTIGPFYTKRGAVFMRDHGQNNPHCQTVQDAERLGRLYQKQYSNGKFDFSIVHH